MTETFQQLLLLFDLTLTGGSVGGSSLFGVGEFGVGGFGEDSGGGVTVENFYYGLREDPTVPAYVAKIVSAPEFQKSVPPPGQKGRALDEQQVTVRLSNIHMGDTTEAPTASYLLSQGKQLLGAAGKFRWHQVGVGDIASLMGIVIDVPTLTRDTAELVVAIEDHRLLEMLVPTKTTRSIFPSANTDSVTSKEHAVVWPFGDMRLAELALCMGGNQVIFTTSLSGTGNLFIFVDLTNIPDLVVPANSGYYLEYDVLWASADTFIAMDLECSDGTDLRDTSPTPVDQNNLSAHPSTDISAKCMAAYYRRRISLAALNGKTITQYKIAGQSDSANQTKTGWIAQAVIVDSTGQVVLPIITNSIASYTTAIVEASTGMGVNNFSLTKDNAYYFGPIQLLGTLVSVYRGDRAIPTSDYAIVSFISVRLIKFTSPQIDSQGNPVKIRVDLTNATYSNNPARVILALLANVEYGAGVTTDGTSFTAAIAAYNTLQLTCGGGLDRQRPLGDVLNELLWHGAYLDRGANGIEIYVDTAALHTASVIELEEASTNATLAQKRRYENCIITNAAPGKLTDRLKKLEAQGFFYPGFQNQSSWLLGSDREQAIDGGTPEPLQFPLCVNGDVLDRLLHYEWEMLKAWSDQPLTVQVIRIADALRLMLHQTIPVTSVDLFFDQVSYVVREQSLRDGQAFYRLTKYPSAAYTYVRGSNIRIDTKATQPTDFSFTTPSAPVNFVIVSEVVRVATDGTSESLVTVEADAPTANPTNISHLVFRLTNQGEIVAIGSDAELPAAPGEVNIQFTFVLKSELTYTLRCYSRNRNNAVGFQNGAFATSINKTGPPPPPLAVAPVWVSLTQVPGQLVVNLSWSAATVAGIIDTVVYRRDVDNSALANEIGRAAGTTYTDASLTSAAYGQTRYYWLKWRTATSLGPFSQTRSVTIAEPPGTPPPSVVTQTYGLSFANVTSADSILLSFTVPTGNAQVVISAEGFTDRTGDGTSELLIHVRRASDFALIAATLTFPFDSSGGGFGLSGTDSSPPVSQNVVYHLRGQLTSGGNASVSTVTVTVNIHSV